MNVLENVLWHIHNWFEYSTPVAGTWIVEDGELTNLNSFPEESYYRVQGSIFNDGLHLVGAKDFDKDETFKGTVTLLAIPLAVIELAEQIAEYIEANPASNLTSESFGGYSYSKGGSASSSSPVATWEDVFSAELAPWRKLS